MENSGRQFDASPEMNAKLVGLQHVLRWPVSRRARKRVGILKVNPTLRPLLVLLVQSKDKRLLYLKNPKTGCTTITSAIYEYSFGHPPKGMVHWGQKGFHQGINHWEKNYALLKSDDRFLFASVRDPLSRALSAFKDIFVDQKHPLGEKHLAAIKAFGFSNNLPLARRFDIFLNYVSASFEKDELWTDPHWCLQTHNLAISKINYDLIIRMENLQADLARVPELAGISDKTGAFNKQQILNASPRVNFKPSTAQCERVFDLYRRDYEVFGYPFKTF